MAQEWVRRKLGGCRACWGQGRRDPSDRLLSFWSCLPHFSQTECFVMQQHEEFIWLHDAYEGGVHQSPCEGEPAWENRGYTSLAVRGSQPGRTGGTPVSLCRGACLGPQGGGEAGPGFRVWVMAILIMRGLPALSSFEQIPSAPPRPDSEAARRVRLWVAVGGKPLGVLA